MLLQVKNLAKGFPAGKSFWGRNQGWIQAVREVSFDIPQGSTLGLVGESGCGKSTLARTLVRLYEPEQGQIIFQGQDIAHMRSRDLKSFRRGLQMVFQDPFSSLNPRLSILDILLEPYVIHKLGRGAKEREMWAEELLDEVGLSREVTSLYPHELSGGQRQRIGIARALALKPQLIIADEPVSALDVSIQAQVLNLFVDLKSKFNLSYLFIAHDLAVVKHVSDFVAVMYLGRIVEYASCDDLYLNPQHPYTQALFAAVPRIVLDRTKKKKLPVVGDVPSPLHPPSGCAFHPRCPVAIPRCKQEQPELRGTKHQTACHLV